MQPIHEAASSPHAAPDDVLGRLFAYRRPLPAVDPAGVIANLPRAGAVFALAADDGALVQLLSTGNLRRAVGQRLSAPTEQSTSRRASLASVARALWWQPAYSQFEAGLLYLERARQLLGAAYRKSLAFARPAYACIDLRSDHPRWAASEEIGPTGVVTCGPFDARRRCARFIGELEDLFDLCRYHQELVQAPHGQRCEYYDMGKCPAPCDGTVAMSVYRGMLADSVRFATGNAGELCTRLEIQMNAAAADLAFERAQRYRDALARARAAAGMDGRWAARLEQFRCLIVQRGPRRGTLRPFFCDAGEISREADVRIRDVDFAARDWSARAWSSDKSASIDASYRADCIALVCHHLGKREKASGLFQITTNSVDPSALAQALHARFSRA